jgi:hypothetical protein
VLDNMRCIWYYNNVKRGKVYEKRIKKMLRNSEKLEKRIRYKL